MDGMDTKAWLDLAQWAVMLFIAWWIRHGQKHQATESDVRALEGRVAHVEGNLAELPDHKDLGEIYKRMNSVDQAVHTVIGELSGIKSTLTMINQHLLGK